MKSASPKRRKRKVSKKKKGKEEKPPLFLSNIVNLFFKKKGKKKEGKRMGKKGGGVGSIAHLTTFKTLIETFRLGEEGGERELNGEGGGTQSFFFCFPLGGENTTSWET